MPNNSAPTRKATHDTPLVNVEYAPGEWAQIPRRAVYESRRYKLRLPHRKLQIYFNREGKVVSCRDLTAGKTSAA